MSKKKKKEKKNATGKIQKKLKKFAKDTSKSSIILGIAGGAVLSGLLFAGIRSGLHKNNSLLEKIKNKIA